MADQTEPAVTVVGSDTGMFGGSVVVLTRETRLLEALAWALQLAAAAASETDGERGEAECRATFEAIEKAIELAKGQTGTVTVVGAYDEDLEVIDVVAEKETRRMAAGGTATVVPAAEGAGESAPAPYRGPAAEGRSAPAPYRGPAAEGRGAPAEGAAPRRRSSGRMLVPGVLLAALGWAAWHGFEALVSAICLATAILLLDRFVEFLPRPSAWARAGARLWEKLLGG